MKFERSKMKKYIKGFYWHVHHLGPILEYCYDFMGRIEFIKKNKPVPEIEERLRVMQPVKSKLPRAVIKAGRAYAKARLAYCRKLQVYKQTLEDNKEVLDRIHTEECKNCSWDGLELNFKKKKE